MALVSFALPALPFLLWFLYLRLRYYRMEQLKGYPRLKPDLIFGHLKAIGEEYAKGDKNRHVGRFNSQTPKEATVTAGW